MYIQEEEELLWTRSLNLYSTLVYHVHGYNVLREWLAQGKILMLRDSLVCLLIKRSVKT